MVPTRDLHDLAVRVRAASGQARAGRRLPAATRRSRRAERSPRLPSAAARSSSARTGGSGEGGSDGRWNCCAPGTRPRRSRPTARTASSPSRRTPRQIREVLVTDWWDAATTDEALMIAFRRSDVADLNARARALMREAGRLRGDELEIGGAGFCVGDQVVIRRGSRRLGVVNGERGTITGVDSVAGSRGTRARVGTSRDVGRALPRITARRPPAAAARVRRNGPHRPRPDHRPDVRARHEPAVPRVGLRRDEPRPAQQPHVRRRGRADRARRVRAVAAPAATAGRPRRSPRAVGAPADTIDEGYAAEYAELSDAALRGQLASLRAARLRDRSDPELRARVAIAREELIRRAALHGRAAALDAPAHLASLGEVPDGLARRERWESGGDQRRGVPPRVRRGPPDRRRSATARPTRSNSSPGAKLSGMSAVSSARGATPRVPDL